MFVHAKVNIVDITQCIYDILQSFIKKILYNSQVGEQIRLAIIYV